MTSLQRLPLLGGQVSLDFVNTVDPRFGPGRIEYLSDYPALLEWAVKVGVTPPDRRPALLAAAARHPRLASAVHARALTLREDLYRLLRPAREGDREGPLRTFNAELRQAAAHAVVRADADAYDLGWDAGDALDQVLWPVVRDAGELMLSALGRVRECDGRNCGWLFRDTSKAGRRRWCSMEICGNRAKAARHRQRTWTHAS